jgi:hypothetical protein
MTSSYSQLILFDCDGGRASLFNDQTIVSQLPSNCECYLFWNKDSHTVTDNLNRLSNNPQIHLCPSFLQNSKNSADGKLIYFLGKLVEDFPFIVIVHGNDNIYNEVVEAVVHDYNRQKIEQKKIPYPNSQALQDLFMQLRSRNEQNNYVDPNPKIIPPRISPIYEPISVDKKCCSRCSKKFKEFLSLYDHITDKHKQIASIKCACSSIFTTKADYFRHREQIKLETNGAQFIIHCNILKNFPKLYLNPNSEPVTVLSGKSNQCSFKCRLRYFEPSGLISHLGAKHGNSINIRVQCCDPNTRYTLTEFRLHVRSQHSIVDIQ